MESTGLKHGVRKHGTPVATECEIKRTLAGSFGDSSMIGNSHSASRSHWQGSDNFKTKRDCWIDSQAIKTFQKSDCLSACASLLLSSSRHWCSCFHPHLWYLECIKSLPSLHRLFRDQEDSEADCDKFFLQNALLQQDADDRKARLIDAIVVPKRN